MIPNNKSLVVLFLLVFLTACASGGARTNSSRTNNDSINRAALSSAQAHTNLGAAYLQENKLEIALEEFNIAVEILPTYAMAYNGLGMVRSALGQDEEAEYNFKKSLQLDPTISETSNNYGTFLCSRGRYAESVEQFLNAVSNPLYSTPNLAYANAGICAERGGDSIQAEQYLKKALALQPLTHSAAHKLADIQFKRSDFIAAKKTLSNALVSSPNPEMLWLGIQIARKLGDKNNEASYTLELNRRFPNSKETQLLLGGN